MVLAKAKRLFQVAQEIGIESKAILEKCRAEGLDLQNHMAAIPIGLEMTIREWFSEHDSDEPGSTAIETAEKVDLAKIKKARPRKKLNAPPAPVEEETPAEDTAQEPVQEPTKATKKTAEPEPEPEVVEAEAPAPAEAEGAVQEPVAEPVAEAAAPEAAKKAEPATAKPKEEPKAQEPPAEEAKPVVKPAGPQLVTPKAAKLRGPKVIRVEEPEVMRAPRPRRAADGGPARPAARAPEQPAPDVIRSRGPVRGRGAGGPAQGQTDDESGRSPRRNKRTGTASPRKGRTGDADVWFKGVRREQDLVEREERLSHAAGFLKQRRREMKKRAEGGSIAQTPMDVGGRVEIAAPFTIKDLSAATGIKGADIIKFLFNKGIMTTINHAIDSEAAMEVCLENDIELIVKEAQTAEEQIAGELEAVEYKDIRRRPPVVAVLGHVDHGKTSLLDRIRSEDVASGEAGGITQHIGAFRTTIKGSDGEDKTVVFLDTPGHQAFTNMRARGANLADIVVLVVAADDGMMPQTIESINHAKAAKIPIVVALNKIDKPEATEKNIQRIYGQLAEHELNPTEWGGSTEVMKVSATTGTGVPELIEVLDYQAELLELKAGYDGQAHGQVIEAQLDMGRGPIARVLVREGNIKVGDFVVIGRAYGKVRSMTDDHGKQLQEAGPATPIEIAGIDEVPDAGDKMYVTTSLKQAENIAEQRRERERKKELATKGAVTLDNVFEQMKAGQTKDLRVVLKADVQGSMEVLKKAIEELGNEEVTVKVLHVAVGGITESDVLLAEASDAVIIGFQVIASQQARNEAERRGVEIRLYRVIYDIVDDVKKALEGMLAPTKREDVLGHAEVREVFRVSKVGSIAGCYITDGVVRRNAHIRVTRDGIVIEHDRTLETLKRFKDDAKEVRAGMECGMKIEGYDDIRQGDVLECYVTTTVKTTLA
ncbi:MAG: translation initiation factor IF-2 [Planctomycetes bacterium]|nr:translation initiation factor IF-2 [Planctomycetota bacterium]